MTEDNLQFKPGTSVQLQQLDVDHPTRYTVKLIGYLPDQSMIVTNPEIQGRTVLIGDNQRFIVRMLQGDMCSAFEVKVILTHMLPYPHLHLTLPERVESTVVRNSRRVNTVIAALIANTEGDQLRKHEAMIVDLSASGAKIATRHAVAQVGDLVEVFLEIDLLGKTEKMRLLSHIQSAKYREGDKDKLSLFYYGVKFENISRYQEIVLFASVMQMVVEEDQPVIF